MAVLDFEFGRWHNGQEMGIDDIMYSLYFAAEWGTQTGEDDRTFDAEFTPRAAQSVQTVKGIRQVDADTIEIFTDFWHFDQGEIADWVVPWSTVPWEITAAMERAVTDGKASFSRSGATSKNTSWLSLIIPSDAGIIRSYLEEFREQQFVPEPLKDSPYAEGFADRYGASIRWIEQNDHAVISNGPFYLESYAPESRAITVVAFDDESYPFAAGRWGGFEEAKTPLIRDVSMEPVIQRGKPFEIGLTLSNADSVLYFLSDREGNLVSSKTVQAQVPTKINISSEESGRLGAGTGNIRMFAVSDTVTMPDHYESSFVVTEGRTELPMVGTDDAIYSDGGTELGLLIVPIILGAATGALLVRRRYARP